jgi:hypothetical protein
MYIILLSRHPEEVKQTVIFRILHMKKMLGGEAKYNPRDST